MKYHFILLSILTLTILTTCKTNKNLHPSTYINQYPLGKNGLWGYANEKGEIVIDYQFEEVSFYHGDRAIVKQKGKYGFIDPLGNFVIKPKYDSIGYFNGQVAHVFKKGKSYNIDRRGKKYNKGILNQRDGEPFLASNPADYFIDRNGNYQLNAKELAQQQRLEQSANFTISDFTFEEVIPFSQRSVVVKKNDKYGIFVHHNHVGLKDLWVDEIIPNDNGTNHEGKPYHADYALFRQGEMWGIVSEFGYQKLAPEYYSIEQSEGIFYIVEYRPDHWGCLTLRKKFFQ